MLRGSATSLAGTVCQVWMTPWDVSDIAPQQDQDQPQQTRDHARAGEEQRPSSGETISIEDSPPLRSLWCTACHWHSRESADCPWQAQHTCIFCCSSDHRHSVKCNQPAIFDHCVPSCTICSFQKKTPSQHRLALKGQHWRDADAHSRGHSSGNTSEQDSGLTNLDGAETGVSDDAHTAHMRSTCAHAEPDLHAHRATDVAIYASARAELTETRAANRHLKLELASLRRQVLRRTQPMARALSQVRPSTPAVSTLPNPLRQRLTSTSARLPGCGGRPTTSTAATTTITTTTITTTTSYY